MPPKKDANVPDGPKPKRVMTPEQLEKLAAARIKAKAVRDAMKDENDDHKIRILQAKMDAIKKTSKKKPDPPEPIPELKKEELVPEQMTEPEPEPEPVAKPVKQKPKKGKKPVVIVDDSGSESSSDDNDNSNVIYIRRKKKKHNVNAPPPPPQMSQAPQPSSMSPANPFFTYNWSHKNFQ